MRSLLLTGVAMAALLLTPLTVSAQPDSAADPYGYSSTQSTVSPSSASSATTAPATTDTTTGATSAYESSPNATAAQADAHAATHGATADATTAAPSAATADTTAANSDATATADANTADTTQSADATTEQPDAYAAQSPDAATAAAPQQAYAQNTAATENLISDQAALELAHEAGLAAVPMAAADVCATRTVELDGTSDLSPTNQVEAAVDRASVCRLQAVTIQAPRSRAASLQRTLEARGVDASMINVEQVAASETAVRMEFRGLATSSPSFAALYNPQYAANTSAYDQSQTRSDAGPGYAPSATPAPDANISPAPATPADPYATTPDTTAPETAPEAAPSSTAPSETF